MEEKINRFKEWLFYKHKAANMYGEPKEIDVWEEVIEKVNEIFN